MSNKLEKGFPEQHKEADLEKNQEANGVPDSAGRQTRRNLIKAGLIGIPVVITLKSRPAWGQSTQETPSAMASLTHQSHAQQF
jgi:hypothetical protein